MWRLVLCPKSAGGQRHAGLTGTRRCQVSTARWAEEASPSAVVARCWPDLQLNLHCAIVELFGPRHVDMLHSDMLGSTVVDAVFVVL